MKDEYFRDLLANKPIHIPYNYFPNDDPSKEPILKWRSHANLLYRNWLNYVYQLTHNKVCTNDEQGVANPIKNKEAGLIKDIK